MVSRINKMRRTRRGFTLVELLVVVLILAILMAVALPLYLNAQADAEKKTCRANMQTIANAEQAYKVSSSGRAYTTNLDDLKGDLGAVPKCPKSTSTSSTDYQVAVNQDGTFTVSCQVDTTNHGTFTPGKDSR